MLAVSTFSFNEFQFFDLFILFSTIAVSQCRVSWNEVKLKINLELKLMGVMRFNICT